MPITQRARHVTGERRPLSMVEASCVACSHLCLTAPVTDHTRYTGSAVHLVNQVHGVAVHHVRPWTAPCAGVSMWTSMSIRKLAASTDATARERSQTKISRKWREGEATCGTHNAREINTDRGRG